MAGSGPCSLAAVSVSGGCLLFPSRYFAGAVLACVWLSSSVASVSPVVAAVGLAVAASQRLAALAVHRTRCLGKTQRRRRYEVSLSSAGGEERRRTTNKYLERQQNHERPQSRYVRARLRCSSRASLPLTPRLARLLQQLECALPLRSGQRKSQSMDSFGPSGVVGNSTRPALPASLPP